MKGCRPLLDREIALVLAQLEQGSHPERDRALFLLGLFSGFRISELLSLKVSNVFQAGKPMAYIAVSRRNMKGKEAGRSVRLHPEASRSLERLFPLLPQSGDCPLFLSRQGESRQLGRGAAWCMLTRAYAACGLGGKLGTHCMRKSLAKRVYDKSGKDIRKVQEVLQHANLNSTAAYIGVDQEEIDDLILTSWGGDEKRK